MINRYQYKNTQSYIIIIYEMKWLTLQNIQILILSNIKSLAHRDIFV